MAACMWAIHQDRHHYLHLLRLLLLAPHGVLATSAKRHRKVPAAAMASK